MSIGDKVFARGDKVVLWYNSANRDEAVFGPSAEEFDVARRAQQAMLPSVPAELGPATFAARPPSMSLSIGTLRK